MRYTPEALLLVARPAITPSSFSRPFWEATRDRRLLIQYCPVAQAFQFYPRPVSLFTARRNLEWREVSGRGTLFSYTVTKIGPGPFRAHTPYVVALVELGEGVRMLSNLVNCDADAMRIGMRLVPYWLPMPDGTHLPLFQPEDAAAVADNPIGYISNSENNQ